MTYDEVLQILLKDLETPGKNGLCKVPEESTIRLLGAVNAACARNMRAADWFTHHKEAKEKKP